VCASLDAHDGPCTVIHAASTGVLSGGSEGKIILWSPELEQVRLIVVCCCCCCCCSF
jgi:hypothetical protein